MLNKEQHLVYIEVLRSVENETGNIHCLHACVGTGKTILINLILSKVRSQRKIALATA